MTYREYPVGVCSCEELLGILDDTSRHEVELSSSKTRFDLVKYCLCSSQSASIQKANRTLALPVKSIDIDKVIFKRGNHHLVTVNVELGWMVLVLERESDYHRRVFD